MLAHTPYHESWTTVIETKLYVYKTLSIAHNLTRANIEQNVLSCFDRSCTEQLRNFDFSLTLKRS